MSIDIIQSILTMLLQHIAIIIENIVRIEVFSLNKTLYTSNRSSLASPSHTMSICSDAHATASLRDTIS